MPRALAILGCCLAALGCGGSGSLTGQQYRDGEASYRVGLLDSPWERLHVEDQNDLAWSRGDLRAIIQINASCDPALDIPLVALTNHLLIGFTEREIESQELFPMASREALRTHLRAKLDGVPRELALVVLKKDGCVYDFALIVAPGPSFERARADFDQVLGGFSAP